MKKGRIGKKKKKIWLKGFVLGFSAVGKCGWLNLNS